MYTIAIDLGGTVVKIGLLSDGEIVDCVRLPSRLALGLAPNLPKIKEAIDRLLAAWRIDVAALRCIGLAFPGLVDPIHNRVISTNEKYDDACSISLDKWAWENWEVPFCMDNDARLAVAGEWWQGAARGKNNVVMMTIGTGIGTGVVIDGRLLYGQHFQAGSLGGHFVLDYKGRRCSCGNKGCVEALSSSFFLPLRASSSFFLRSASSLLFLISSETFLCRLPSMRLSRFATLVTILAFAASSSPNSSSTSLSSSLMVFWLSALNLVVSTSLFTNESSSSTVIYKSFCVGFR